MKINLKKLDSMEPMEALNILETAYYDALWYDPFEVKRSTRRMWERLNAMYDMMENDSF